MKKDLKRCLRGECGFTGSVVIFLYRPRPKLQNAVLVLISKGQWTEYHGKLLQSTERIKNRISDAQICPAEVKMFCR